MDLDKGSLTGKGKKHRGDAKEVTTLHKQTDAWPSPEQPPWKPKPLSFFYFQFPLLSMRLYGVDYPLDQFWSAVPEVCPPNCLPTPHQLTAAEAAGGEENLDIMATLLSNRQNTSVIYTGLATDPEYSTLQAGTKKISLHPSQTQYRAKKELNNQVMLK